MSTAPRPVPDGSAQLSLADDLGGHLSGQLGRGELTIGEVLTALAGEFPELTISKIRYYERQGLLSPSRSASGYRKFSASDVARLHYALTAARDHYLPLKVIKERLLAADRGEPLLAPLPGEQATGDDTTDPVLPPLAATSAAAEPISPGLFKLDVEERRLSRRELLRESGLDDEQLTELEAYGLIAARGASSSYEADALTVASIVAELGQYGFQARHLRPVKAAVDREVGLIEQTLTPMVRQPSRDSRRRAEQHARGYAALSVRLHIALLEAALRSALR